ncbi:glycosyltransferase family 2 protein [Thalassospira sp. MA62]|nr:glycosyltransferase family 2 protein [Thalassospira sp. MA62]
MTNFDTDKALTFGASEQFSESSVTQQLDVVIVNYNSYDDTLNCVSTLISQKQLVPENIHIVDNCSPDGSGERLRQDVPVGVNVVLSQANKGFGAGVNIGADNGGAPYILILNPDCVPETANLHAITEHFARNPDVGLIGAELINPDGTLQYSARTFYSLFDIVLRRTILGRLFPFNLRNRSHLLMDHPRKVPFDVDWVMGTGLCVRRDVFERVGKMDEDYFLYMEDVDLCARVHDAGYRVQLLPAVRFIHDHRRQSGQAWKWTHAHSLHLASLKRFAKHHRLPWFCRPDFRKT